MVLKIIALVAGTILIMFFLKKIMESICNLIILLGKKNYYDVTKQRQGIVINKKTKKLEADQSIILPF
jgi:hypothetical protein